MSNARGDVRLAAFFLLLFTGMVVAAFSFPGTSRTMPIIVGGLGITLSASELVRAARRRSEARAGDRSTTARQRVMVVWLAGGIVAVTALGVLGGTAVFVGAYLRVREREPILTALLAALTLAAVLHLSLERALGLTLYRGLLFS